MSKIKIIGLGSCRMVGKDTFLSLLGENSFSFQRFAFADALKESLENFSLTLFDKNISQLSPEQKEILRPVLIAGGRAAREINKDFWVNKVLDQIDKEIRYNSRVIIPVITDVRYCSEYNRIKKQYGDSFLFVNIERIGAPEPTEEEKIHAPELKKLADVNINWQTDLTFESLRPIVCEFYQKYIA